MLELHPSGERLEVDRVVTVPVLDGPAIDGLPHDAAGFLPVDAHGRVTGSPGVYAAGDATDFEIKQGGIACQQADAAAEAIAAGAGVAIDPAPFAPVLRGLLLTEHDTRWLQRDLGLERGAEPGPASRTGHEPSSSAGSSRGCSHGPGTRVMTRSATLSGGADAATERWINEGGRCRSHCHRAAASWGRGCRGVPSDPAGFIRTDAHGRVLGMRDVFAAGDATAFPIKQGGLAAQQADAVAEAIAASVGAGVSPQPFRPVLRGLLTAGGRARYMRGAHRDAARAMTAPSPSSRCGGRRTGSAAATSRPISAAAVGGGAPCSKTRTRSPWPSRSIPGATDGRRLLGELADLSAR